MWTILCLSQNKQINLCVIHSRPKHCSLLVSNYIISFFLCLNPILVYTISKCSLKTIPLFLFSNEGISGWPLITNSCVSLSAHKFAYIATLRSPITSFFLFLKFIFLHHMGNTWSAYPILYSPSWIWEAHLHSYVLLIYFYILVKKECAKGKQTSNGIYHFEAQFHNQFDFQLFYYSN